MSIVDKIDKLSGTDTRSRNITQAIDKYSGKGPSKNIDDAVKKLDETGTLGKMGIKERIDHLSNAQTMSRDITQAIDRHTGKGPSKNIEEALKWWENPTPPGPGGNVVFDGVVESEEDEVDTAYFTPLIQVENTDRLNVTVTDLEWDIGGTPVFTPEPQPITLNKYNNALIGHVVDYDRIITFSICFKPVYDSYIISGGDASDAGLTYYKFHLYIEKAD